MCNTIDDDDVADVSYSLFAVVVHLGSRPDHGNHILFFDFFPFWGPGHYIYPNSSQSLTLNL